jgi:hypothetical protein
MSRAIRRIPLSRAVPTARLLMLTFAAACGGAKDSVGTGPGATTGTLTVTVSGASAGVPSLQVTGPAGFAQTLTATTTINSLAPGAYTITAADLRDVGLRYQPDTRTVASTVTAGGTATATITYALPIAPRVSTDRSDEVTGAQVKLVYALPSDGVDRGRDTAGVLQRSTSSWQRWLATQTGGRYFRLDTFGGGADILFIRLPRTDAVYRAFGAQIRDEIERDLVAAGVATNTQKIYLTYYDGGHIDRCASAAWPPALPGRVGAIYLQGTIPGGSNCNNNPFVATPTATPGYLEFLAPHELMHLLGTVATGAPDHGFSGHTINDPADLMYAGTSPWRPATFDAGRRNYYNPAGLPAGLGNFATSPYVVVP